MDTTFLFVEEETVQQKDTKNSRLLIVSLFFLKENFYTDISMETHKKTTLTGKEHVFGTSVLWEIPVCGDSSK